MRKWIIIWLLLGALIHPGVTQERVVERILAIVEGEIITLTDVQVALAFGLFPSEKGKKQQLDLARVLENLIDLQVVLKLAESEKVNLSAESLNKAWEALITRLGKERFQRLKKIFGLSDEDVRQLLQEKLTFDQIIQKRITLITSVSLDEIQDYYQNVYLKNMAAKHQKPRSLVEVMRDLEIIIRKEKGQAEVRKWLRTLRSQADIVIKDKEMINHFRGEKG